MKQLTATNASRNFADVLNDVEDRGESFLVMRRGRPVAEIRPVFVESGKVLKEALRASPPDPDWVGELRELRQGLESVPDRWND